jgi:DNA-binding NarL/FixJ family response regulator
LVADDPHMRETIAHELAQDVRIRVIAVARSAHEGKRSIATIDFDVMLTDLKLRDGSGYELLESMKRIQPAAEAVVVSVMEDDESALHAFALGASGYLIKSSWFGNFVDAILQVVNGGAAVTPTVTRRLLKRLNGGTGQAATPAQQSQSDSSERLSPREREVLRLVSIGYTSCEIGKRLFISNETVNAHLKHAFRKLGARTRAQAVTSATAKGLLFE